MVASIIDHHNAADVESPGRGRGVKVTGGLVRPCREVLDLERQRDLHDSVDHRPQADGQHGGDEREPGPGKQPEREHGFEMPNANINPQ